jgi:hypothetical protein
MGVAGPKDFVAIVKRLPIHLQRLTNELKRLFVAILSPNQVVFDHQSADSCRKITGHFGSDPLNRTSSRGQKKHNKPCLRLSKAGGGLFPPAGRS